MRDVDAERLERALAFQRGISERESTRVERFRWGAAYFLDDVPFSYDQNFVDFEVPLPGIAPEEALAEADRLQGGADLEHRELRFVSTEDARRFTPAFRGPRWRAEDNLYMALLSEPERAPDTSGVRLAPWEDARPAIEKTTRRQPYATTEEVVRQLVDRTMFTIEAVRTRFLVSEVNGEIASYCLLFTDGTVAQIEDVNTLEEHRGRGLALATVHAAVAIARSEGHDLIWLVADGDDWPQHMYRKLGFRDIGSTSWFIRAGDHE